MRFLYTIQNNYCKVHNQPRGMPCFKRRDFNCSFSLFCLARFSFCVASSASLLASSASFLASSSLCSASSCFCCAIHFLYPRSLFSALIKRSQVSRICSSLLSWYKFVCCLVKVYCCISYYSFIPRKYF